MIRKESHKEKKDRKNFIQYFFRNPRIDTKLMDIKTVVKKGSDDIELKE